MSVFFFILEIHTEFRPSVYSSKVLRQFFDVSSPLRGPFASWHQMCNLRQAAAGALTELDVLDLTALTVKQGFPW